MTQTPVEISLGQGVADIDAAIWDACADVQSDQSQHPTDPFTTHRFLAALEVSGSVGEQTGWLPHPIIATLAGETIAVAPLYLKSHSQGEYVFDHGWANAFHNAGGSYYPKFQIAAPFTPAAGRRILARPGMEETARAALLQGMINIASENGISSAHITFCDPAEIKAGQTLGLLHRTGQQFHWTNGGFATFDEFLTQLSSRKRKSIRRERRIANQFGGEILELTGDQIQPHHWDAFWEFYQSTGARKWGTPYLTRAFFDEVQKTMRDDVLLILAERDGQYVAGALNFIGRNALFGRYWGCTEHHPCLHFELCYYRAIDYAIAHKLNRVEAGAQGDHKLARGYLPVTTHSLHWIADPGFRDAVERYLIDERDAVSDENAYLCEIGPFRKA